MYRIFQWALPNVMRPSFHIIYLFSKFAQNIFFCWPIIKAFPVVMMGLDNAGKSTILYRMRTGHYCETIPTIGFNCEKVKGIIWKHIFFDATNFLFKQLEPQENLANQKMSPLRYGTWVNKNWFWKHWL